MLQAKVTVVSTSDVVKLAAVIVAVAFASTSVQLGEPALSVSIRSFKSTQGETNFFNDNFKVFAETAAPNAAIATLVFAVTSPIFCTDVALANVTISSTNTLSPAAASSHRKYVSRSTMLSTHSSSITSNASALTAAFTPALFVT